MTWPTSIYGIHSKIFYNGDRDLSNCDLNDFPYVIDINREDLPWTWTQWCNTNCKNHWAWWFDNNKCYVGFMDRNESIWFSLVFVGD